MMEPEFNFPGRMNQFVIGKDVTGLLEKTKKCQHTSQCKFAKVCQGIIVGHWQGPLAFNKHLQTSGGMNDFKCFAGPQLNT
jgi:hypothetical protein